MAAFPITLAEHDSRWEPWFEEERELLASLLPQAVRISHVGSTAVEDIQAKPIVDILVELPAGSDLAKIASSLEPEGYIVMSESGERVSLNKGYTPEGFADKVFHVHLRFAGDNDELYFRDCLLEHPGVAREYEKLKLSLWHAYEHDRDSYTEAKGDFVGKHTAAAKREFAGRY